MVSKRLPRQILETLLVGPLMIAVSIVVGLVLGSALVLLAAFRTIARAVSPSSPGETAAAVQSGDRPTT